MNNSTYQSFASVLQNREINEEPQYKQQTTHTHSASFSIHFKQYFLLLLKFKVLIHVKSGHAIIPSFRCTYLFSFSHWRTMDKTWAPTTMTAHGMATGIVQMACVLNQTLTFHQFSEMLPR